MEAKHILIIEDDASVQSLLREAFEEETFSVQTASDGEEALRKLEQSIPDIILLDIILPKKDGLEVLKDIRKRKPLSHIPVVILTNIEESSRIEQSLSMGATTYLVKSNYTLQEIIEKVRALA